EAEAERVPSSIEPRDALRGLAARVAEEAADVEVGAVLDDAAHLARHTAADVVPREAVEARELVQLEPRCEERVTAGDELAVPLAEREHRARQARVAERRGPRRVVLGTGDGRAQRGEGEEGGEGSMTHGARDRAGMDGGA